ncbi:MAG TPA: VWA domain-containing protein [Gallionellaceae bacterium]|nr:VWA domain-containing protein [Gallionellaceae bacterium]
MNPLFNRTLLCCLLLLTACSSQNQTTTGQNLPTGASVAQHEVDAKDKSGEPALKKDELSAAGTILPNKIMDSAVASPAESKRANLGVMREMVAAPAAPMAVMPYMQQPREEREQYGKIVENPIKLVAEAPVSTFSIDVDTGGYSNVRRMLNEGRLPPADAVRVEEMINYFPYAYALPKDNAPFAVHTEMAPAPWNKNRTLLRIGIKGQDIAKTSLPPSNLVFLVDVSGSMESPKSLPLLKSALKFLVNQLRPQDRVSLVTYASGTQVVLEPTSGAHKSRIIAALDNLRAGGSTSGAAGIALAYSMAEQSYIKGGINRIFLATDGDFNVGITNFDELKNMAEEKRKSGVSLSTLGFGMGNYNEQLMEQLADAGNGNYSYIDTLNEGQKVLVDEMTSTLATIAKDVKIQIEFNPNVVSEYRLVGYENRMLNREDFNNDKVDAGEVGAGHTVTAIYELTLKGNAGSVNPLRYGSEKVSGGGKTGELGFLRLRYKAPDGDVSKLMEWPLQHQDAKPAFDQASTEFRFAAAVAAFGQQLRGGAHTGEMGYDDIAKIAAEARGTDAFGYRGEFLRLVHLAQSLSTGKPTGVSVD